MLVMTWESVASDVWHWLLQPNNALVVCLVNLWGSRIMSNYEHRKTSKKLDVIISNEKR